MTNEHAHPDDEAQLDETLAELDAARKQARKDIGPIAFVEESAHHDRLRIERGAEDLDRTYMDLSALRGKAGPFLHPMLNQIRAMARSANISRQVGDIYRGFVPHANAVNSAIGVMSAGANACYAGTTAYYTACQHDPTLGGEPPSVKYLPIYVEEVATADEKQLNGLLLALGGDLYGKLQGARAALVSNQPDHVAQSCNSMQELLDQVLHHFSDDPVCGEKDGRVKRAPWWQADPTAKGGVTRGHRIGFVVRGYSTDVDADTKRRIEDLTEQAKTLGGAIQAEKHHHGASNDEQKVLARRLLGALQSFLLFLLQSHRPDLHRECSRG